MLARAVAVKQNGFKPSPGGSGAQARLSTGSSRWARRAHDLMASSLPHRFLQPAREFAASKTKQIPNKNAFYAWICLVESGLFKGLQGKKTKIIFRLELALRIVALRVIRQSFPFWRARRRPSSN
ncbi:MAG TPA: hypothetical protein VGG79_18110 [Roseiarcus sp.]|jgi:hypothetical protein